MVDVRTRTLGVNSGNAKPLLSKLVCMPRHLPLTSRVGLSCLCLLHLRLFPTDCSTVHGILLRVTWRFNKNL